MVDDGDDGAGLKLVMTMKELQMVQSKWACV